VKEQARQLYADAVSRIDRGQSPDQIVDWLTGLSNPSGSPDLLQSEIAANAKILLKFVSSNAPQGSDAKVFR
jgi:hypothetical protein